MAKNTIQKQLFRLIKTSRKSFVKKLPKSVRTRYAKLSDALEALNSIRRGNKASRVLRYVLEKNNFKAILGGNLAFAVLTTSLILPTSTQTIKEAENALLPALAITLSTKVQIRYPVSTIKINQPFSRFHYGIDIAGKTGDAIYPIMKGKIETKESSRFGYGNQIVIAHENGIKSRYAHLSKIGVEIGQNVNPEQVIGALGSTGWSTGPHLHLEVLQDNRAINPQSILNKK